MLHHFSNVLLRTPLQSLKQSYRPEEATIAIFREGLYLSSPEYWNELQKRDQLLKLKLPTTAEALPGKI